MGPGLMSSAEKFLRTETWAPGLYNSASAIFLLPHIRHLTPVRSGCSQDGFSPRPHLEDLSLVAPPQLKTICATWKKQFFLRAEKKCPGTTFASLQKSGHFNQRQEETTYMREKNTERRDGAG